MPRTTWKAVIVDGPHAGKVTFPVTLRPGTQDLRLSCDDDTDKVAVYHRDDDRTGQPWWRLSTPYRFVGLETPHGPVDPRPDTVPARPGRSEADRRFTAAAVATDDFWRDNAPWPPKSFRRRLDEACS